MSNWVEVLRCSNRVEAEIAKSALESAGIQSLIKSDDLGGMRPDLAPGLSGIRLFVLEEDEANARKMVEGPVESTRKIGWTWQKVVVATMILAVLFATPIFLFLEGLKFLFHSIFG